TKQPVTKANVRVLPSGYTLVSDAEGFFYLPAIYYSDSAEITHVNYRPSRVALMNVDSTGISLRPAEGMLQTVFVSTGYQRLPKERATGSFDLIDNTLINRRVSANIIDRLQGIASGVAFNKTSNGSDEISIRGRSTIYSNATPLIVVDNFPYEGALTNINPNDIEAISILKDAAAASI